AAGAALPGAPAGEEGDSASSSEASEMSEEEAAGGGEAAMEQQTISIAKAGITTMLKSRTSVLAAANPPSGRYDDLKTAQENIDLQSTILSRFDLIFIVKDTREHDLAIARHVLDNHRLGGAMQARAAGRSGTAAEPNQEAQRKMKAVSGPGRGAGGARAGMRLEPAAPLP
ncbi:DNA replication licensing factor mcm5, partial [Tetrabaena socialis]